jgi:hypothetical protein
MTHTESQQGRARYGAGERLYFRPSADRAPFGASIPEGLAIVVQVVDHGSATLYAPRFSYVVQSVAGGGMQGTDERELTAAAESEPAAAMVADISATIDRMTMTNHERAKAANAALTPEQRSAAGKARAAQLHHPVTLARRIGAKWAELSDEDRKAVRRELRAAGVIA